VPNFTPAQRRAVEWDGQLLVAAGAGAGKTLALVERCVARLTDPLNPVSPEQILLVTFTKAAALEMRKRIRYRLEEVRSAATNPSALAEPIALLDSARISTLHVFCLELVRENFHQLGLDPRLTAIEDDRRRSMMERLLDGILEAHYAQPGPVASLVADWAGGDQPLIRRWALKMHDYAQTLRSPERWLREQEASFAEETPLAWEKQFIAGTAEWAAQRLERIAELPSGAARNQIHASLTALRGLADRGQAAEPLEAIIAAAADKAVKKAGGKELAEEADFLASLVPRGGPDPLREDWEWCRRPMLALAGLARQFGAEFDRAKREAGLIDFHDMEQFALRLLWDGETDRPTALAESWRKRLEVVSVDEYQDINEAQNAIIAAVSREGSAANRFLVGDVKQSIYRFRLADPRIFARCQGEWENGRGGRLIWLSDNFRSHETILNFVNALFRRAMRKRLGGIDYTREAELRLGNAENRPFHRATPGEPPRVELLLRLSGKRASAGDAEEEGEDNGGPEAPSGIEAEALLIGRRLLELRELPFQVVRGGGLAPVEWADMAILLRAPGEKRAVFARVFHQLGIPLQTSHSGFLESSEALDLESLIRILDNPCQDLPLLAVLRSPFGGFTAEDLLRIRLVLPNGRFWTALQAARDRADDAGVRERTAQFLRAHEHWRLQSKQQPLSVCLEGILDETFYREWLASRDRPAERLANVRQFLRLTREFDLFQREGLFRFIQYFERQREIEAQIEPAFSGDLNAVRLMSIHQSKGLEFPVVAAADLGKKFNLRDLAEEIILDEEMGLCPMTHPPARGAAPYPSIAHWLARARQRREALGEELRLLYVAATRASDRLILSGAASFSKLDEQWPARAKSGPDIWVEAADSALDWIGCWLAEQESSRPLSAGGTNELVTWKVVEETKPLPAKSALPPQLESPPSGELDFEKIQDLERRLSWSYPFPQAVEEPAKTSVTAMRRRLAGDEDFEARPAPFLDDPATEATSLEPGTLAPAEIGIAHHLFLQCARIELLSTAEGCAAELARLRGAGVLSEEQAEAVNLDAITRFWQSELGRRLSAEPRKVHRELPFTARFAPQELRALGLMAARPGLEDEFVLVQGVIDLALIRETEIQILDFKTDRVGPEGISEKIAKYGPQLEIYARSISRAFNRPVTLACLHFLALDKTVNVDLGKSPSAD
jgi:ATP-dependent helicase/nuclease subunit A